MSRHPLADLSAAERRRMTRLKMRYESQTWPSAILVVDHHRDLPITLHTRPGAGNKRFTYECQLRNEKTSFRTSAISLTVSPAFPSAPTAAEVLDWMAVLALCQSDGYDPVHTLVMFHLAARPQETEAPIRAPHICAQDLTGFIARTTRIEADLESLIGPENVDVLVNRIKQGCTCQDSADNRHHIDDPFSQ
jgi:hypothetical protein